MPRGKTRLIAIGLVALTALLVGFQGASTLLTVTQLGASPPTDTPKPRAHASLVPQPPMAAVKPSQPDTALPPAAKAGEPVAEDAEKPRVVSAVPDATPMPSVPDNQAGVAATLKAKAQAEMDAMGENFHEEVAPPPPQREPRRRYRAPRPELHKVY